MYLEKINSPTDLKELSMDECKCLADEIRMILISSIGKMGGHLSSNLGTVELTIALHYVFDMPTDQLVLDTSHQCYTHKILTGRKKAFTECLLKKQISGYSEPSESIHDLFKFGHTSTSISLACGLAKARDLKGDKHNVIAVVGDGSLGGGEALTALNFGGSELNSNIIIVINDNQMSIAENHGALYKNLEELRDSDGKCENNLFKILGYRYEYVAEGNDVEQLISTFKNIKGTPYPTVLHICTEKGHGYQSAVDNKEGSHFVRPFKIEEGIASAPDFIERYDYIARDYILGKIRNDKSVVVVTAAVPDALAFTKKAREMAGKQYIDVGISEECAISICAGIAKNGGKPIFATRSTFIQRAYDQISQEVCMNRLPVTIVLVNASVYSPTDMTHLGIYDLALLANIPNLICLSPTNRQEYINMLDWSIEQSEYPVVIRAPRNGIYENENYVTDSFETINRFKLEKSGKQIAIIALGDMYQLGEELIDLIKEEMGISASLINPRYASGIDVELLDEMALNHNLFITIEDGVIEGGFGQKVASYLGRKDVKILNYGVKKAFLNSYDLQEILNANRLNKHMILSDIKEMIV